MDEPIEFHEYNEIKPRMSFSQKELRDIFIAWIVLSLAFAMLISGNAKFGFQTALIASFITVGTGFVLHELAHRFVALKFGAIAEFRAWMAGLVFAIITAFLGFLFAAPGAVYIFKDNLTARENGIISIAGPLTNLVIGFFFLTTALFSSGMLQTIFLIGSQINFYLGFFNMLPLFVLDGKKVFDWNKGIWAVTFIALLFLSFGLPLFF